MGTALLHNRVLRSGKPKSVLNKNDWTTISKAASENQAANYWAVGDTKEIIINGKVGATTFDNFSVWVFIIGFNHNSSIEGTGKTHFQIGKTAQTGGKDICLVDSYYQSTTGSGRFSMKTSSSNYGGWGSSTMRTTILGSSSTPASPKANSLLAALPSDLLAVMKSCTKYTDNYANESNYSGDVKATTDYLWLLARYEVHGNTTSANAAEKNYQKQYDYYAAGNSKVKYRHSAHSSAASWWQRSPNPTSQTYFCIGTTAGGTGLADASQSFGIAPAFCV